VTTDVLVFDRRTSALLGEQYIVNATGVVHGWSAYRTSRIVDGIPGNPPGPLTPPCVNGGGYDHQVGGADVTTGAPVK
jgi:hypothetical protein